MTNNRNSEDGEERVPYPGFAGVESRAKMERKERWKFTAMRDTTSYDLRSRLSRRHRFSRALRAAAAARKDVSETESFDDDTDRPDTTTTGSELTGNPSRKSERTAFTPGPAKRPMFTRSLTMPDLKRKRRGWRDVKPWTPSLTSWSFSHRLGSSSSSSRGRKVGASGNAGVFSHRLGGGSSSRVGRVGSSGAASVGPWDRPPIKV